MATTTTTINGGVGASDWFVSLANMAGMNPNDNIAIGSAPTMETMRVLVPPTATQPNAIVLRGARGTQGRVWTAGTSVTFGGPTNYGPGVGVTSEGLQPFLDEVAAKHAEDDIKAAEELKKKAEEEAAKEAEKEAKAAKAAEKAAEKDEANSKPAHTASHTAHK